MRKVVSSAVRATDENGNVVGEWASVREAAAWFEEHGYGKCSSKAIARVCRGERKTYRGLCCEYTSGGKRPPEGKTAKDYDRRLHKAWAQMKQACTNENANAYEFSGGIGATVCDEWQTYPPFEEWAKSQGYDGSMFLRRKDKTKGFSPDNCGMVSAIRDGASYIMPSLQKRVIGVASDGTRVEFPSLMEAAKAMVEGGNSGAAIRSTYNYISKCIRQTGSSVYGYDWSYPDE